MSEDRGATTSANRGTTISTENGRYYLNRRRSTRLKQKRKCT